MKAGGLRFVDHPVHDYAIHAVNQSNKVSIIQFHLPIAWQCRMEWLTSISNFCPRHAATWLR